MEETIHSFSQVISKIHLYFGVTGWPATFWERATHSVYCMFSVFELIVILVISHFGFEGRTLGLIASVPGHCLSFTL